MSKEKYKTDAEKILNRYHNGESNQDEKIIVEGFYLHERPLISGLSELELQNSINKQLARGVEISTARSISFKWPFRIAVAAASIAIVITIWTLLFTDPNRLPAGYANDIAPGSSKATLVLDNGEKIELSGFKSGVVIDASKLTYNDGTLIGQQGSKTFTITTPRGGTYQVQLPDGSKVWLNAASSISYNMDLSHNSGIRKVGLTGEAYFEVFKDRAHPFVVSSNKMNVTVLGTHFNVSAYDDDADNQATLLEGSVKVASVASPQSEIVLKPDQQASLSGRNVVQVSEVDAAYVVAWKDGEFAFRNKRLDEIMKQVSRWYSVEVVYDKPALKNKLLGGTISKFSTISKLLCMLEVTAGIRFKVDGKTVTVTN
jgi:transmembrane sensor